jgi:hypothetical protein
VRNVRARLARLERLEEIPTVRATLWDVLSGSLPPNYELTADEERDIRAVLGEPPTPGPVVDEVEQFMARLLGDLPPTPSACYRAEAQLTAPVEDGIARVLAPAPEG